MLQKLGDVAEVFNGKTPPIADQRSDGYPVLKIRDVIENSKFSGTFNSFVDIEFAERFREKWLCPEDTLILNAAHNSDYVGSKAYLVETAVSGVLPTGEWLVVRPLATKANKRFIHYWLLSQGIRKQIKDRVKGIHLYPRDVAELPIRLPSIDDQRRIAAILDKANAIRSKRRIALKLADDYLGSAFVELCRPAVKMTSLSDIAEVITGFAFQSESYTSESTGIRLIRGTNVGTGQFDWSETAFYPKALTSNLEKFSVRARDVLLAMDRPWISSGLKCCIANRDLEGDLLVQRVARIRPRSDVDSEFIFRCLNSHQFVKHCRVTETTIPHISPRDLASFPVPDIDPSEKERFGKLAWRTRDMTSKMSFHLAEANQAFNALSHRAFGGQV